MSRDIEDAILQSNTLSDLHALRKTVEAIRAAETPADNFAHWLHQGPPLAKAAGLYVEIKVRARKAYEAKP